MAKIEFNPEEPLRIEDFEQVAPHQVWAFNVHFQQQLNSFDYEYRKCGGIIGGAHHQYNRQRFAQDVAKFITEGIGKNESLYKLEGWIEFNCPNIGVMTIEQTTTLNYTIHPLPNKPLPLYAPDKEHLRVELFGDVRPHQSAALNRHLQYTLEAFDKEFEKCGGDIGSIGHRFDRYEFAKLVSEDFLDDVNGKDSNFEISALNGETKYYCSSMPITIIVKSDTTIGNDIKPPQDLPYFEPN